MHRVEYGGCCVRVILSDKTENYLDSEKVYIPVYDFMAIMKVLAEFRDSFITISDNMYNSILMKKVAEELHTLNDKASSYYSEAVNLFKGRSTLLESQARLNGTFSESSELIQPDDIPIHKDPPELETVSTTDPAEVADDDIFGDATSTPVAEEVVTEDPVIVESPPVEEPVIEEPVIIEAPADNLQPQMDEYIKTESPNIDLELNEEDTVRPVADTSNAIVSSGDFTEKILQNDVMNLEMYVTNLVNDDLPFGKLCEIIQTKLGFDPLENVNADDVNSVNYLISHHLKHSLKKSLEEQVDFPSNVSPILFTDVKLSTDSISLMYDLFIYFIYYTQLRNMLKEKDFNPMHNRDFMCFSFKTIASPLAITGFNQVDEGTLISEISNRYLRYRENGVFDKLREDIKHKYSCEFDLPEDAMRVEASRIYQAVQTSYEKLTIPYAFNKFSALNLKLGYEDFQGNTFQDEQIKKIVAIEFNFRKHGKVVYDELTYQNFDDIPASVLEKFEIKETKYDNTNLKRYIKELTADQPDIQVTALEIAEKINYSYRDLINVSVDLTILPVEILRSIFLWDIDRDSKITLNYLHYREVVQKCSLTKDMVISLLTNIQDVVDVDFINSFMAVRNQ
jgi:hypothetical protein